LVINDLFLKGIVLQSGGFNQVYCGYFILQAYPEKILNDRMVKSTIIIQPDNK